MLLGGAVRGKRGCKRLRRYTDRTDRREEDPSYIQERGRACMTMPMHTGT